MFTPAGVCRSIALCGQFSQNRKLLPLQLNKKGFQGAPTARRRKSIFPNIHNVLPTK